MPNNVIVGQRFYVAKQTILFSAIPAVNSTSPRNIDFIYWLDNNSLFKLYEPGNPFSTLNGFVAGESYQIAAFIALDLTAYLGIPAGSGTLVLEQFTDQPNDITYLDVAYVPQNATAIVLRNGNNDPANGGYNGGIPYTLSGGRISFAAGNPPSSGLDRYDVYYYPSTTAWVPSGGGNGYVEAGYVEAGYVS